MKTIALEVVNESGELVTLITSGTERGSLLSLKIEAERIGGVVHAEFFVAEGNDVPFFTGNPVLLYVDGVLSAGFDIKNTPGNRGEEGTVLVEGIGFCERLKKVLISETFTAQSVIDIITYLTPQFESVGIFIDEDLISALPAVSFAELTYEDVTLYDVVSDLMVYSNGYLEEDKLTWDITPSRYFRVLDIDAIPISGFYEGFSYQSPNIDTSFDSVINTVSIWRKKATSSESEYVDTYLDASSRELYGLYEEEVKIPYYASATDCARIAEGILSRYSVPIKTAKVTNLLPPINEEGLGLPFGKYALYHSPKLLWKRMFAGQDIGVIDLSFASGTTLALSTDALVGKTSLKFMLSGVADGYASLPLDPAVLLPRKIRLFMKAPPGTRFTLGLIDSNGDGMSYPVYFDEGWVRLVISYSTTVQKSIVALKRESDETDYALALKRESDETDYCVTLLNRDFISSLKEIRFHWETASTEILLDYIDIQSIRWEQDILPLAKASYSMVNKGVTAEAEFGKTETTTPDQLSELWEKIRRRG